MYPSRNIKQSSLLRNSSNSFRYAFRNVTVIWAFLLVHSLFTNDRTENEDQPQLTNGLRFENATITARSTLLRNEMLTLQRLLIDDYLDFHKQERRKAELSNSQHAVIRTLVFKGKLWAGLGDRLRGVVQAYLLAVATRRVLLIDWEKPFPLHHMLDSGGGRSNFSFDESVFVHSRRKANGRRDSVYLREASFSDLKVIAGNINTVFMVVNRFPEWKHFMDLWQTHPELGVSFQLWSIKPLKEVIRAADVYSAILGAVFRTSEQLRRSIDEVRRGENACFPCSLCTHNGRATRGMMRYVSIHARLGSAIESDSPQRFNFSAHGLSMRGVAKCMARHARAAAKRVGDDVKGFFIATDTEEMRYLLKDELRLCRGCDEDTRVMHAGCRVRHVRELHGDSAQDYDMFVSTFIDLAMLAGGEALVSLKSGYADLASWMGALRHHQLLSFAQCSNE